MNRIDVHPAVVAIVIALSSAGCPDRNSNDTGSGSATAAQPDTRAATDEASPAADKANPAAAQKDRFAAAIASNLASVPDPLIVPAATDIDAPDLDNQAFRVSVAAFVRQVSAGVQQVTCDLALRSQRPFRALIWIYLDGAPVGRGEASDPALCVALKDAARRALASSDDARKSLDRTRFAIHLPDHDYSLIEFQGKGVELDHGLVPVRVLDKALLQRRIDEGKAYLLRVINPERRGVHKYYRAPSDQFESTLHTIYTASTIYTMLRLHAHEPDPKLVQTMKGSAEFLLSMQSRDERDRGHGGFYYSYDLQRQEPNRKLVVGTTSKTIFTLIELHALTQDARYMEAARLAADWLLTMQRSTGRVASYARQTPDGRWRIAKKESMLYTGQVLSALSRMYTATGDRKYLDAAARSAKYVASKVARKGCYLGDDYRKPNPISSSWVILSLFDYFKITDDPRYKEMVFGCADELLARQILNEKDVYRYGRWQRSLSSSGNGWLAEVMAELYLYCKKEGMGGCERFEDAIVKVFRFLMQYTYTAENAFVIKNPDRAKGGVFWNVAERHVRTDSVCHAMNAYLYMIDHLGDGPLVQVPEPPLSERLRLSE